MQLENEHSAQTELDPQATQSPKHRPMPLNFPFKKSFYENAVQTPQTPPPPAPPAPPEAQSTVPFPASSEARKMEPIDPSEPTCCGWILSLGLRGLGFAV